MNQPSILIQPMGSLQDIPIAAQMIEYAQKERLNSKTNIGNDSRSRNIQSNGANFQKSFQKILLEDMNIQPIQQQQEGYSGGPSAIQNKKQVSENSNQNLKIPLSESPKRFIAMNLDPKLSPRKHQQPKNINNDNSTMKIDNQVSQSFEDKHFLSDKNQQLQHLQDNNHHHTNKTIIQNFKMRDFPEKNLPTAINTLVYGIEAEICIPSRRTVKKVLLVMSISTSEKIKAIDLISKTQKYIDVTSIKDVEYNVQNESQASIKGVDPKRIVSFVVSGNEDIECLAQFKSSEERDLFMQGFQYFVKKSHKSQLFSGNIIQLRQQINQMVNSENAKTKKTYDLREVSDILQTKAHLSISQPYLSSIYINTIKKDLDLQLKSQKISYSEYQQAISGQQPGKQQRITNAQLLELIDFILDRTELYLPFEKATGITNLYTHDKTSNSLTLEGFKKFVLLDQKEIISISEIEDLFDKILETQLNQPQGIHFDGFADGNQQIDENSAEYYESNRTPPSKSREALSFNAFVRFIYSKNNSIFDPRKENIYQNMDKPINEYYINSAKNIYHANFDIMTMTKLAGRNIGNSDQNFPLLYALSRGARYIEIEVWDGEKDPVIIYGPIMNSKLELSDFLNQLKRLAFSLSPFPLFLQIVNHCSVKQSFKMKYILETVLKDYLYFLPPDYKDMQNLPSPNELREKIILIGKLPHAYDEIIKESYTYSDAIQARLQQVIQAGKDSILADHNKGQASQLQSIAVNGTAPTNGFSVVNGTNNGAPNDIHNANTTVNFNQSSQLIFSNLTANPLNSPNRQVSASVQFLNSNNNNANLSVASNKGKGLEDLSLRQQQLSGLPSLQNRSLIASSMTPIDGTLLTPIHALSLHNIGDSLDQEMMEFIMKEELEELTPERIIAIPSKAINTNIDSNSSNLNNNTLLLKPKSTNPSNNQNLQELISESEFIANPNQQLQYFSSVKAIDNFFHKNQEQPPKFKRFLQTKYDEITTDPGKSDDLEKYHLQQQQFFSEQQEILNLDHAQPTRLYNVPVLLGESIEVLTPRDSQLSSKLQIGRQRNGTLESQKYNKEGKNIDENKSQNDAPSGVENGKNTKSNRAEDNHSILKNKPSFKKDSLRLQGLIGNGYTSGSTSNRNPSPQAFQVRCIRDYAPIRASNSIESLFGLYVSKIWEKKPALWEIYEFTQRDLSKDILSKQFLGSVLGSFSSLSSFTRQHLAIGKPRCKTADSINLDPLPLFAQGVQFVLNYFHTFDRGSLMYQSKFQQNGGETSGYVLKPFNQRNHFAYSPKKSPKSPKKQIETLDKIPVSNNQTITKITDASQPFDSKQDNTGAQINQPSENSNNNNNINNDSIIKNNNGKNQSSDSILVPSTSTFPQIFSLNPANLSPNKRQRGSKYLNQATDQDNSIAAQLAYEQEEIDNYSLPNLVHIKIISGYNLSTSAGDKVDPYVELIVEDGQEVLDFKTGFVENNNMKPLWYHDVKFTVNQPLFCFLLFQCINTSTGGLIGWFALPFNCVRQGFRVIPLRDGFFNVIKNSFILCEITIVKCPLPE